MTIRIGLIGGGNISETHARAASQTAGVEIAAVYGTNATKVEHLSRQYGGKAFLDLNEFFSHRPMDMVVLGSPSGVHASQGIEAVRRGLHVLTEKPMDVSTAQADALIEAGEKARVKVGVIFQDRLKPEIRQLKQSICDGHVGKVTLVDARVKWYRPPEYYSGSRWQHLRLRRRGAYQSGCPHGGPAPVAFRRRVESPGRGSHRTACNRSRRYRGRNTGVRQRRSLHLAGDHRRLPWLPPAG